MPSFFKSFLVTFLIGAALVVSFWSGYLYREKNLSTDDYPVLIEARNLILQYGLEDPPEDPGLEYGMIRGMLQAYGDQYTSFSEPVQHELTTNDLEGRFGGIGVQLSRDSQNFPILIPLQNSPAIIQGVVEGDRLTKIDEMSITPETDFESIQAGLRGKVGTKVEIHITRPPSYTPIIFSVIRQEYSIPSVNGYLAPTESRLGIIKVNRMASTTTDEIMHTVVDLKERGALVFALDLRDNFGGLLTSGVDTARLFLDSGIVMQEKYKGDEIKSYYAEKPGSLSDLEFVIFVNENTASAAEIAAGALQNVRKIILIGTPTYGKDTVQLVFELHDKSSLQLSAAKWWIPEENNEIPPSIMGRGLQPNVLLDEDQSNNQDIWIQTAINIFYPNK